MKSGLALMRDDTRMPDVAKFVEELVTVREEAIRLEGPTARAAEEVGLIADEFQSDHSDRILPLVDH